MARNGRTAIYPSTLWQNDRWWLSWPVWTWLSWPAWTWLNWPAWTWLNWPAWTWLNWPAWTWLSWPAWTWLLTDLFMHVGTDCSWLDERTDLNNVVGTIMINQQPCSYMIERVVREWWNNKIEQRCYNNHELGCCIKSGFCITYANNPCRFTKLYAICWNMIGQYCYFTNPVLSC